MLACFSCLPKTSVGMSSKANQQSPRAPARVTDGVSLFPEGPGGTSYLESAIKDVFGKHSGQVIDDLYDFSNAVQKNGDFSDLGAPLLLLLQNIEFLGKQGDRHIQLRAGASADVTETCNEVAFQIKTFTQENIQALTTKLTQKNILKIATVASIAFLIIVGIVAAIGLLGSQFTLPLAVYVSLGAVALTAVAGSQFAYHNTIQSPCVALWRELLKDTLADKLNRAVQSNDAAAYRILLEPFKQEHSLFPRHNGNLSPNTKPVVKSLWTCFNTVWLKAVREGNLAVCQAFIEVGVPVNGPFLMCANTSPIVIAIQHKYAALCTLLLAAGAGRIRTANPKQPPTLDKYLWKKALLGGDPAVCQAFIQTGLVDVNARDDYGTVPLAETIDRKNAALCAVLLAAGAGRITGANPDQPPTLDPSFWWQALRQTGHDHNREEDRYKFAVCQALLDSGLVDMNATNNDGLTPLAYAIASRNRALCKLLLAAGAGRIPNPALGQPPILDPSLWWKALGSRDPGVCQAFIDSGLVDINAHAHHGRPPLYNTLFVNYTADLAKVLLAAGAHMNVMATADIPLQPLNAARGILIQVLPAIAGIFWREAVLQGRNDNCRTLLEAAKDPNTKLLLAAYYGDSQYFTEALRAGADKYLVDTCLQKSDFDDAREFREDFLNKKGAELIKSVQKEFTQAADVLPADIARVVFDYAVWPVLKDQPTQPPK